MGRRRRSTRKPEVKSENPSSSKKVRCLDSVREKDVENASPQDLELNPLNIPVILKIILNNVEKVEDLKNIRAVSKQWMEESLGKWRSTAVLLLHPKVLDILLKACIQKMGGNNSDEDGFFELFEKPFLNFRYPFHRPLAIWRSYPLVKASEEETARTYSSPAMWEHFFSKAKYLDIDDCLFNTSQGGYMEGLKWILRSCPDLKALDINPHRDTESYSNAEENKDSFVSNLESLTFGRSIMNYIRRKYPAILDSVEDEHDTVEVGLQEFFKMIPNLKHLSTHSGKKTCWGEVENCLLLSKALDFKYKLESITLIALRSGYEVDLDQLKDYLDIVQPSVKNLVLSVDWRNCVSFCNRAPLYPFFAILGQVASTLTKLELYINCVFDSKTKDCFVDLSNKCRTDFPVLTHLKLSLSYTHFFGNLPSFCFGSLRKMKKLKEFSFETQDRVAKDWIKRKLGVEDLQPKRKRTVKEKKSVTEELSLPDLERFHFHGNFTSEAMELLGKWAPNIKKLEVVLDKENFNTAFHTWPGMNQVKILPCSEIPKKLLKQSKRGCVILDESEEHYITAWNGWVPIISPDDCGIGNLHEERMFCLATKAYKD